MLRLKTAKRKGFVPVLYAVGLLLVIVMVGKGFMPIGDMLFSITGDISESGCRFAEPSYGTMYCEPLSHTPVANVNDFQDRDYRGTDYDIQCGDDEYTKGHCSFMSVTCEGTSNRFYYQSSVTPSCKIGGDDWCIKEVKPFEEAKFAEVINIGERHRIGGCFEYSFWGWDPLTPQPGEVKTFYIPYGLRVEDSNGKDVTVSTRSCNLGDVSQFGSVVIDCGLDKDCSQSISMATNSLNFDTFVNWVDKYEPVLVDLNHRYVTWQGKEGYCEMGYDGKATVKSFTDVTTKSGTCYSLPDKIIADSGDGIECCPGMTGPNAVCDIDFKWHVESIDPVKDPGDPTLTDKYCKDTYGVEYSLQDGQCVRDRSCWVASDCTGGGEFVRDYSTTIPTVVKYGCVSGQCEILDKKTVECTLPDYGCTDGDVCNPDTFTCESQKGVKLDCGDGVCTSPYETELNCPADCTETKASNIGALIGLLVKSMILSGIVLMLVVVISFVFPPLRAMILVIPGLKLLFQPRVMLAAWLILALTFMVIL